MFKIIQSFLQSKFFKQIQEQYTIIFGYISGSKGINCSIDGSDYDIFFICKEEVSKTKRNIIDYYLKTEKETLHYTVFDIKSLITKYEGKTTLIGMMSTSFNIIPFYVNPMYKKEADKILKIFNNPLFKELGAREYSTLFEEKAIEDISINNNLLNYINENKQFYQLALFSFAALDYSYQDPFFHEFIQKLRKMKTEDDDFNYNIQLLTKIFIKGYKKIINSHEYTIEEIKKLLLKEVENYL